MTTPTFEHLSIHSWQTETHIQAFAQTFQHVYAQFKIPFQNFIIFQDPVFNNCPDFPSMTRPSFEHLSILYQQTEQLIQASVQTFHHIYDSLEHLSRIS